MKKIKLLFIDINKLKGEKKITDVSDFSIIINIANLIPAGSITLEKAHMNYILINHENGNEPSEIIQELIKANYNKCGDNEYCWLKQNYMLINKDVNKILFLIIDLSKIKIIKKKVKGSNLTE